MNDNVPYYHFRISSEITPLMLEDINGFRRMDRMPIFDEDDEFCADLSRIAHSIGWEL